MNKSKLESRLLCYKNRYRVQTQWDSGLLEGGVDEKERYNNSEDIALSLGGGISVRDDIIIHILTPSLIIIPSKVE